MFIQLVVAFQLFFRSFDFVHLHPILMHELIVLPEIIVEGHEESIEIIQQLFLLSAYLLDVISQLSLQINHLLSLIQFSFDLIFIEIWAN